MYRAQLHFLACCALLAVVGCSSPVEEPEDVAGLVEELDPAQQKLPGVGSGESKTITDEFGNGTLRERREVRVDSDGKRVNHGRYELWHPNSKPEEVGSYRNGIKVGEWKAWFDDGSPKYVGSYRDGKKHGPWTEWQSSKRQEQQVWRDGQLTEQRILKTDEFGEFKIRDGKWQTWYENGNPRSLELYDNGEPQGTWQYWHEDESQAEVKSFKDGKEDGVWKAWHPGGESKYTKSYKEGKPDGTWISKHENGKTHEQGSFVDGQKDGVWTTWLPDGSVTKTEEYDDGKLEGKVEEFYIDGSPWYTGHYISGKKHGSWTTWYKTKSKKDKRVKSIEHFTAGEPDGEWKYWHQNGKLEREEHYKKGKPSGKWIVYRDTGAKVTESEWVDGLLHGVLTRYDEKGEIAVAKQEYEHGHLVKIISQGPDPLKIRTPKSEPKSAPDSKGKTGPG